MSYVYTSPGMLPTSVPITVSPNTVTYPNQINWGSTMTNGSAGGIGTYTIATDPNLTGTTLHVKGDAQFEGDVTFEGDVAIKGKSIKESLEAIEERLAILRPNEELENKWDKLRELRKQYMELEAEIIEKEKIWAILKK
jgi:hypothetical protein